MPLLATRIRHVWPLMLYEGLALMVLGGLAILLPPLAGILVAIMLGWVLFAAGLAGLFMTLMRPARPALPWSLFSDFLAIAIGLVLFVWPTGGMIPIAAALAAFLALDGAIAMVLALQHRRALSLKWRWLLANGILDIVLALVILIWLPGSAAWTLGLAVGSDLLLAGATLVAMALDERRSARF